MPPVFPWRRLYNECGEVPLFVFLITEKIFRTRCANREQSGYGMSTRGILLIAFQHTSKTCGAGKSLARGSLSQVVAKLWWDSSSTAVEQQRAKKDRHLSPALIIKHTPCSSPSLYASPYRMEEKNTGRLSPVRVQPPSLSLCCLLSSLPLPVVLSAGLRRYSFGGMYPYILCKGARKVPTETENRKVTCHSLLSGLL